MASIANTLRSINVFRDEPVLDEQGRTEADIQEDRKASLSTTVKSQDDTIKTLQSELVKALDTYRKTSETKVFAHFKGLPETKASVAADFARCEALKKVLLCFSLACKGVFLFCFAQRERENRTLRLPKT